MRERALLREENELLSDLSFGLRAKLALSINKHYLHKMPFFAQADEKFVSEVSSHATNKLQGWGGSTAPRLAMGHEQRREGSRQTTTHHPGKGGRGRAVAHLPIR